MFELPEGIQYIGNSVKKESLPSPNRWRPSMVCLINPADNRIHAFPGVNISPPDI
jgi:hypothetical protein